MGQLSAAYRIKPPHNFGKRLPAPKQGSTRSRPSSARLNQGSARLNQGSARSKPRQCPLKTKAVPAQNQGSAECGALRSETTYACGNSSRAPLWGDTHGRALAEALLTPSLVAVYQGCNKTRVSCFHGCFPLFRDTSATPILLEFLEDTRVGRMLSQILLAGGPGVDEGDLGEVVLWVPEEEGAESSEDSEEEDGLGPPL